MACLPTGPLSVCSRPSLQRQTASACPLLLLLLAHCLQRLPLQQVQGVHQQQQCQGQPHSLQQQWVACHYSLPTRPSPLGVLRVQLVWTLWFQLQQRRQLLQLLLPLLVGFLPLVLMCCCLEV